MYPHGMKWKQIKCTIQSMPISLIVPSKRILRNFQRKLHFLPILSQKCS